MLLRKRTAQDEHRYMARLWRSYSVDLQHIRIGDLTLGMRRELAEVFARYGASERTIYVIEQNLLSQLSQADLWAAIELLIEWHEEEMQR